ncbi:hypothetical protein LEMLEM_LOCUS11198 [Lemmus lemmus]
MWCHLRDGVLFLNPDRPRFITHITDRCRGTSLVAEGTGSSQPPRIIN